MLGKLGDLVLKNVTWTASLDQSKIDIDAGRSMVLKIVALVLDMHITNMANETAEESKNVPQYANGVIGVNGVNANRIVNKVYDFKDEQIMKTLERFNFSDIPLLPGDLCI